MEYHFYQLAYPGLEGPQALRRITSNTVLSLFWLQLWQTKQPHSMLAPATPTISSFTVREMSQLPTRLCGRSNWNCKLHGRRGAQPLQTTINRGTSPLKFPPYLLFTPKGSRKTINVFSHFHGLIPDTKYKHLECFVMLGTHSELRKGQMSHICDISTLRVKYIVYLFFFIFFISSILQGMLFLPDVPLTKGTIMCVQ